MKSTTAASIYQLKITLQEFQPPIWRRVQVPATIRLDHLHNVFQIVMGWTNSHLHAFEKDSISYGDSANDDFDSMDTIPEQRVTVNSLLRFEGEMMVYLYDFGDDWRHDVALEKILPAGPVPTRPVCLAGEFHCPPEDVGGVPGYEKFVDVILEPTHEDYRRLLKWSGGSFEAGEFDILAVNDALSKLRYTVQGPSM